MNNMLLYLNRLKNHARHYDYRQLYNGAANVLDRSNLSIEKVSNARVIHSPYHLLFAAAQAIKHHHILEFGVYSGKSINKLAEFFADRQVWGFDSFEGLPENWVKNTNRVDFAKGTFALPTIPAVRQNVQLVKGYFNDTLDEWLLKHPGNVRLLHIDCDLYSSTTTVLSKLNPRITKGTVMIFDELCRWDADVDPNSPDAYEKWPDHEWKALHEWICGNNRTLRCIARNDCEAAIFKVLK